MLRFETPYKEIDRMAAKEAIFAYYRGRAEVVNGERLDPDVLAIKVWKGVVSKDATKTHLFTICTGIKVYDDERPLP